MHSEIINSFKLAYLTLSGTLYNKFTYLHNQRKKQKPLISPNLKIYEHSA